MVGKFYYDNINEFVSKMEALIKNGYKLYAGINKMGYWYEIAYN